MVKITREECLREFYPEGIPKHLLHKPAPPPKPTAVVIEAGERLAPQGKSLGAVLQDAGRAEEAAAERLRQARERLRQEQDEKAAAEHKLAIRQSEIDAAWQRSMAYRRELAEWRVGGCNRGPGDPDWPGNPDW
jgi:hypothetical protein